MNTTPAKKVGLALSGGGARGMAHIGALEVLKKEDVPIHVIAGTSAGAVIGAAYAWNQDVEQMKRYAIEANWKKVRPLIDPSFPKTGFIKGRKIKNLLSTYVGGNTKFSDLKIPFSCVSTDIDTGEEIVMNSGPVVDALRATISIPGIFTLVRRDGRYLVDGGLTTPVPVNVARRMGADFVIAVNVNPHVAHRVSQAVRRRKEAAKEPNIFHVLTQSIYITTHQLAHANLATADVIIEPEIAHIGAGDFNMAEELIGRGREAAQKAMPELKKKLAAVLYQKKLPL